MWVMGYGSEGVWGFNPLPWREGNLRGGGNNNEYGILSVLEIRNPKLETLAMGQPSTLPVILLYLIASTGHSTGHSPRNTSRTDNLTYRKKHLC